MKNGFFIMEAKQPVKPDVHLFIVLDNGINAAKFDRDRDPDVYYIEDERLDSEELQKDSRAFITTCMQDLSEPGRQGKRIVIMRYNTEVAQFLEQFFNLFRAAKRLQWHAVSLFHNDEETEALELELGMPNALQAKFEAIERINAFPWIKKLEVPVGNTLYHRDLLRMALDEEDFQELDNEDEILFVRTDPNKPPQFIWELMPYDASPAKEEALDTPHKKYFLSGWAEELGGEAEKPRAQSNNHIFFVFDNDVSDHIFDIEDDPDVYYIEDDRLDDEELWKDPNTFYEMFLDDLSEAGKQGKRIIIVHYNTIIAQCVKEFFKLFESEKHVKCHAVSFFHNDEDTEWLGLNWSDVLLQKEYVISSMNYFPWIQKLEIPVSKTLYHRDILKMILDEKDFQELDNEDEEPYARINGEPPLFTWELSRPTI
jgi:hypothetical protein